MKIRLSHYVEDTESVMAAAKKAGLTNIDHMDYTLSKVSVKISSPYGYADNITEVIYGYPQITRAKDKACLYMQGMNGAWFRTSAVQKVIKKRYGFHIETKNSVYRLLRKPLTFI